MKLIELEELLLANKAEVDPNDSRGITLLHLAAVGMGNRVWTSYHVPAGGDYKDVVKLLLACKADFNAKDTRVIHLCIWQ